MERNFHAKYIVSLVSNPQKARCTSLQAIIFMCLITLMIDISPAWGEDAEVGHWTFNEGSGAVALDSSGFGNDGALNGSVAWDFGISGSALDFAGGSDRVVIADSTSLDVTETITLAAWIKPGKTGTQYIVKKSRFASIDGYELSLSGSGGVFVRFNQASSGNGYRLNSQSNYPTDGDTWMHVAATHDGQQIKLYVDGILEASLPAAGLVIGSNDIALAIGAQDDGLSPFEGVIDQVHIYNYALSVTELQDLIASESNIVDSDGDGVPDEQDAFPNDPTEWLDTDGDGTGNNADTDDDEDGMPDDWEILYGFDPLDAADASEDADLDGVSNLDEFLQGTNPRDNLAYGQVGHWTFDEGSGSIAEDLSGNNHTGYLVNGPTWVDGRLGKALLFEESLEQRVFVGDSSELNLESTSFSIVFWIKYDNCIDCDVLRKGSTETADDLYKVEVLGNKISFNLNTDDNLDVSINSPFTSNDNIWHQVVAIRDTENELMSLYIDGEQVASRINPAGSVSNAANLVIGSKDTEDDDFLNGSLDNLVIYDFALYQEEVLYLFNSQAGH